jgi:hypothetical protein
VKILLAAGPNLFVWYSRWDFWGNSSFVSAVSLVHNQSGTPLTTYQTKFGSGGARVACRIALSWSSRDNGKPHGVLMD